MNKPWIGYLAAGFLFLSGILEYAGGYPKLGIFLVVLSVISLLLRIYLNKKIREENDRHKGI